MGSCCKKKELIPTAVLIFEGLENNTEVYVINTIKSNINAHIDTSYLGIIHDGEYNNRLFLDFNYENNGNYIILIDDSYPLHTITDIEIEYKNTLYCGERIKDYNFNFDNEKIEGARDIVIQY